MQEMLEAKQAEEEAKRKEEEAAAAAAEQSIDQEASSPNLSKDKDTKKGGKADKAAEKAEQEKDKKEPEAKESGAPGALSNDNSFLTLQKLPDRDNIDNDFKPVIIKLWQELVSNYKGQMKKIFKNIRMQREQINIRNCAIREQFLEYLHTLDGK